MTKARTRTFNGCLTCRSRKVKCDRNRPSCNNCQRLDLACQGYGVQLHWQRPWSSSDRRETIQSENNGTDNHNVRSRTGLFDGETGRQWSEWLVYQVKGEFGSTVDHALIRLEEMIRDQDQRMHEWRCNLGPFGAMKIRPGQENLLFVSDREYSLHADIALEAEYMPFDEGALDWSSTVSSSSHEEQTSNTFSECSVSVSGFGSGPNQQQSMVPGLARSSLSQGSPYLPRDVRFLMSHYTNFVIDSLASLPHPTAPWKGLHVPCALSAFVELDFLGRSNLARVSVLYSLLSLASFHLSTLYESGSTTSNLDSMPLAHATGGTDCGTSIHWASQARKYREIARVGYHKCVRTILEDGTSSVKYKEMLMAAMNLVCTSIISDDSWDARYYIIQCENIVREIGHSKPRFSESSMRLHQIMMFVQAFEQSTFLQSSGQYEEKLATNYTPVTERVNLLEFMPGGPSSLSRHPAQGRLSLEEMGLDETLQAEKFLETYGFDLQLLFFLSRTNKLAGLLDDHIQNGADQGLPSPNLVQDAASLEEELCSWKSKSQDWAEPAKPGTKSNSESPGTSHAGCVNPFNQMRFCLTNAMHQSLIIYFFRCVRHTNPLLLQQYVGSVLDNLEEYNYIRAEHFPDSILGTIVWPAFIAACDALSMDLKTRALQGLRQTKTSGFRNAETAERVVHEVWRRREEGVTRVNWRDLIREMNVVMVLT